jgi:hypothetical protein
VSQSGVGHYKGEGRREDGWDLVNLVFLHGKPDLHVVLDHKPVLKREKRRK